MQREARPIAQNKETGRYDEHPSHLQLTTSTRAFPNSTGAWSSTIWWIAQAAGCRRRLPLQEVQGMHLRHAQRHPDWPACRSMNSSPATCGSRPLYGGNAVYEHGHHGNAILSRHPIPPQANQDVSRSPLRKPRPVPLRNQRTGVSTVRCIASACISGSPLGSRRRQMAALVERLDELAPDGGTADHRRRLQRLAQPRRRQPHRTTRRA